MADTSAIHEKALEAAALSEGYNALQAFMRLTTQKASECAARGEAIEFIPIKSSVARV